MTEEADARLTALIERKKAADLAAAAAADDLRRLDAEREKRKKDARAYWQDKCIPNIRAALDWLNERLVLVDLRLETENKVPETAAIARYTIEVASGGKSTEKRLVFNVNAFGTVQLVQLIPHSGPSRSMDIWDLTEESVKGILLDFLDLAVIPPAKDKR